MVECVVECEWDFLSLLGDVELVDDTEKEREMSLVLMVVALLCGRDDQQSVPVMSHSVLAA